MELRYNPLTDEWVMVSATRQSRPTVPEDVCPLCPGGPELPNEYDLVSFENRFPALKREAPHVLNESSVFKKRPSKGICEVVVYTEKLEQRWIILTDRYTLSPSFQNGSRRKSRRWKRVLMKLESAFSVQ